MGNCCNGVKRIYSLSGANLPRMLEADNFTAGKNEYYPIPQRQIDLSAAGGKSVLTQNKGY
jgi:hypothetical protein